MTTNVLLAYAILLALASVLTLVKSSWPPRWRHLGTRVSFTFFVLSLVSDGILFGRLLHDKPFFDAVRDGNEGSVKALLAKNPKLIQARTIGVWVNDTALHLAAGAGNIGMVKLLLEEGADVNAKDDASITPLHLAALHGYASVAETLLTAGANVNATGFKDKNTPLCVAARNGHLSVVKVLLAHGADINAVDNFGKTALQYAKEKHRTNVVVVLPK